MGNWTAEQLAMLTPSLEIRRYIGDGRIEPFPPGHVADISFPNGYNKGPRVHPTVPALNVTTTQNSFIIKEAKPLEESKKTPCHKELLPIIRSFAKSRKPTLEDVERMLEDAGLPYAVSIDGREVICGLYAFGIDDGGGYVDEITIRRLTPWECYRFMGFSSEDAKKCYRAGQRDANLYHQAGDSIVTTVLMAIFGELLELDYDSAIKRHVDKLAQEGKKQVETLSM